MTEPSPSCSLEDTPRLPTTPAAGAAPAHRWLTALLALALAGSLGGCQRRVHDPAPPPREGLPSLALIGDTPYGVQREADFDRVIDHIQNSAAVRLVLHTGDIKAGGERCDDAVLQRRFAQFQRFRMAFIYTPGDNDWTDCHRRSNGTYHPLERLERVRALFFPQPGQSTGQHPIALRSQATEPGQERHRRFVENNLWTFERVVMATVHVVGSHNDLMPWADLDPDDGWNTPRADRLAAYRGREAAALDWIDATFDEAERTGAPGVLLAMQANPALDSAPGSRARRGFDAVVERIVQRTRRLGRPVLLAHGDTHHQRVDRPMADTPGLLRVENFGPEALQWVEIQIDAGHPEVFRVRTHRASGASDPSLPG